MSVLVIRVYQIHTNVAYPRPLPLRLQRMPRCAPRVGGPCGDRGEISCVGWDRLYQFPWPVTRCTIDQMAPTCTPVPFGELYGRLDY